MELNAKKNEFTIKEVFTYLLIYKFVIEFMYINVISPKYGYMGLALDISYFGFFVSNAYLMLLSLVFPKNKNKPSTYLLVILYLFIIIPTLSYYWMNNKSLIYLTFVVISSVIISIIANINVTSIIIKSKTANFWIYMMLAFYLITTIFLIIQRGGIDPRAFNFDEVYDLRSENQLGGIYGYLMNWSAKALCPFFFAYFYFKKKYIFLIPIVILQLLMYLSFGNKAFLFSIGIVFLNLVIAKSGNFVKKFVLSLSLLNIMAFILDHFEVTDILRRAIPYRLLYIPTQIQYQYYEFFQEKEKLLFADGIVGKLFSISSPFSEKIGFVIASYFHNGAISNSNTGIFADAYANGGLLAMLLISIILGLVMKFIDITTNKLPIYIVVGALSYIMFVLNDTSLLTTLFTGGLGLMMLLLLLFSSSLNDR